MSIILLLGGNLGNIKLMLERTVELLSSKLGKPTHSSALYESEPWGFEAEQNFINQVVEFECQIDPFELLITTQNIEQELGRQEKAGTQYESRPIDIDILFYGQEIVKSQRLTIPHPLLHERRFTLLPLMDHWSSFHHPILNQSIKQILKACSDHGVVNQLS